MWITKTTAVKKQIENCETARTALIEEVNQQFYTNTASHLELTMKPLVWAVRSEMTRSNEEQVNQYFSQLVKEEKILEVILIDNDKKILISSNKKNEGTTFMSEYVDTIMNSREMTMLGDSSKLMISAPVLSIDRRIGVLVVNYKNDVFQLK